MISLRFLPLVSLTGLIVLSAVVLGQQTDVTDLSGGSTPTPTPTSAPSIVVCTIPEDDPNVNENTPITEDTSAIPALPTGAECYRILSNGLPESTPFTIVGNMTAAITGTYDPEPPESTPSGFGEITGTFDSEPTSFSSLSGGESSGSNLKVVLPAVLCSVVVACLLVVGLLWFRRSRNRNSTRRHSWVQRPGGWMGDKEEPQADIALQEREPNQV